MALGRVLSSDGLPINTPQLSRGFGGWWGGQRVIMKGMHYASLWLLIIFSTLFSKHLLH